MKTNWIKIFSSYFLVLISSIIISVIFSWLFFGKWYELIFRPVKFNSMFSFGDYGSELMLGGFILSYAIFLPILSFIFVTRKPWLPWLIFTIVLLPFYLSTSQWFLWFIIFTVLGFFLGWLVKFLYKKFKK